MRGFPINLSMTLTLAIFSQFALAGCDQKEVEYLRSENAELKNKVAALEQELSKLKETADYHYQKGVELLAKAMYEEAKQEFETVIERFPTSPFVVSAKEQLTKFKSELTRVESEKAVFRQKIEAEQREFERRRREEEEHRARTASEADQEWLDFRNNEEMKVGNITTWKCLFKWTSDYTYTDPVSKVMGTPPCRMSLCYLEGNSNRPVRVDGGPGWSSGCYGATINPAWQKAGSIAEDDLILVTGEFVAVNQQGEIELKPIRIQKIGYGGS